MCIDEGIGPWKGRGRGIRIFIAGKPHPNGIKIYLMCDRTAYVFDFWIYRGRQPPTKDIVLNFADILPLMPITVDLMLP